MKQNNANTAHDWNTYAVDGTPASGEGSNTYYEGPRFYSYSTCIARHFGSFALITQNGYSVTTAKHKSHVLHALSVPFYTVVALNVQTFVEAKKTAKAYHGSAYRYTAKRHRESNGHNKNIEQFKYNFFSYLSSSTRARKNAGHFLEMANREKRDFFAYCELFGITPTKADRAIFEAGAEEVKEIEKAKADQLKKERKARERKEARQIKKYTADFYAGESNSAPTKPYDLIRLEIDNKGRFIVRTGRQVVLSAPYVLKLWKNLKEGQITEGAKVDIYTLRSVKEDTIEIGCHTYHRKYLEQFFTLVEGQICSAPEGVTNFVYTDWKGGQK